MPYISSMHVQVHMHKIQNNIWWRFQQSTESSAIQSPFQPKLHSDSCPWTWIFIISLVLWKVMLCSPLEPSPSVFSLCHYLCCKSIWLWPLAFKKGEVLTWWEFSVDISQDKAKLFFIVWSSSLSWNRRHNYTQQLPWLHIPWDQINFSCFGPPLLHLVYPLSQILSQWMGGSSPLQKVIPSIWGCACKILTHRNTCPWPVVGNLV